MAMWVASSEEWITFTSNRKVGRKVAVVQMDEMMSRQQEEENNPFVQARRMLPRYRIGLDEADRRRRASARTDRPLVTVHDDHPEVLLNTRDDDAAGQPLNSPAASATKC